MRKTYKDEEVQDLVIVKEIVEKTLKVNLIREKGFKGDGEVQDANKIFSKICFVLYHPNYAKIGFVNKKDHAAIIHQIKKCDVFLECKGELLFKEKYSNCLKNVRNHLLKIKEEKEEELNGKSLDELTEESKDFISEIKESNKKITIKDRQIQHFKKQYDLIKRKNNALKRILFKNTSADLQGIQI